MTKLYDLSAPIPAAAQSSFLVQYQKRDHSVGVRLDVARWQDYLCRLVSCCVVDGVLWYQDEEGDWSTDLSYLERVIDWSNRPTSEHQRLEMIRSLKLLAPRREMAPSRFLACKEPGGGPLQVVDLETMRFVDPDSVDGFFPNVIRTGVPVSSSGQPDLSFVCPTVTCFLDDFSDFDEVTLRQLQELIGLPFLRDGNFRVLYFLLGEKHNGKSTFLDAVSAMYGSENVARYKLEELLSRFRSVGILGKICNFGDDVSSTYKNSDSVSFLKTLSSGGEILYEYKGRDTFTARTYCKGVFTCNEIPRFDDATGALQDRMIIIRCRHQWATRDRGTDPNFLQYLLEKDARQALLVQGLLGVQRIIRNGYKFTRSAESDAELRAFDLKNSNLAQWIDDCGFTDDFSALHGLKPKDVYWSYVCYCRDMGLKPMSRPNFDDSLARRSGASIGNPRVPGADGRVDRSKKWLVRNFDPTRVAEVTLWK